MTTPTGVTSPPGALYALAAQFRRDLGVMQDAAADQLLAAHTEAYREITREYVALMARVQEAQEAGRDFSPAWLYQQARLREALVTTQEQIDRFAAAASATAVQAQAAAVRAAAVHAAQLGRRAVQDSGVAAAFTALNPANLEHLIGFLADGSPLTALFSGMGEQAAEQIRSALIRGIGLGKGVDWMRRQVETALDVPRWRAETIMRTESHRVYRSVARETYTANSSVLNGWVWVAALDARTCPCCIVMHGTEHPVDATLDGHPRCRCAMVPRTKTYDEILGLPPGSTPDSRPEFGSGKEWLQGQSETAQRAILGRGKYEAWKAGEVTLEDFVARTDDPDWGTMRRERSLREIRAGQHANWHGNAPATVGPAQPQTAVPAPRKLTGEEAEAAVPRREAAPDPNLVSTVAGARERAERRRQDVDLVETRLAARKRELMEVYGRTAKQADAQMKKEIQSGRDLKELDQLRRQALDAEDDLTAAQANLDNDLADKQRVLDKAREAFLNDHALWKAGQVTLHAKHEDTRHYADGQVAAILADAVDVVSRLPEWRRLDDTGQQRPFTVVLDDAVRKSHGDGSGAAGMAHVGGDTLWLNPHHPAMSDPTALFPDPTGHLMPSFTTTPAARYFIAHEFGHITDSPEEAVMRRGVHKGVLDNYRDHVSTYGASNAEETYAELFAEWMLGEKNNPAVKYAASVFGWDMTRQEYRP